MPRSIYLMSSKQTHSYEDHGHPLYYCKIGISGNPESRLKQIQTGCPFRMFLDFECEVYDAVRHEDYWHDYFQNFHLSGEWFALDQAQINEMYDVYLMEDEMYAEGDDQDYKHEAWDKDACDRCFDHLEALGGI